MKKLAAAVVDPEGNPWAAGLRELKTKSASDMHDALLEIFSDLDDRIEETRPAPGEEESPNHTLLKEIRFTISDKARTQQLLNEMIEVLVNRVIPKAEAAAPHLQPKDTEVIIKLKNFYCGLHNLVHMAEVMASAANEAEIAEFNGKPPAHPSSFKKSANEATGVSLVRKCCKAFAAGADEKSGCHGEAAIFLQPTLQRFGEKTIPLTPFRGHRFNILMFNSEYVYCLWD